MYNLNSMLTALKDSTNRPPPVTPKRFSPSVSIDIVDLCRRLIAEFYYIDEKSCGQLSFIEENIPVTSDPQSLVPLLLRTAGYLYASMVDAVSGKSFTKIGLQVNSIKCNEQGHEGMTREEFSSTSKNLKKATLDKLYWMIRMRYSCALLNQCVGQLIPELRSRNLENFLLPTGLSVPFDSVRFRVVYIVPKQFHLLQFQFGAGFPAGFIPKNFPIMKHEEVIEAPTSIDLDDGPLCQHVVLCFNLKVDTNSERLYVIDPSIAQFGGRGPDGGLVYFGFWEDYLTAIPAEKVIPAEFKESDYIDNAFFPYGSHLLSEVLKRLEKPICHFCGDAEGTHKFGKGIIRKTELKMCAVCKTVSYCSKQCQRSHWQAHKLECKSPLAV